MNESAEVLADGYVQFALPGNAANNFYDALWRKNESDILRRQILYVLMTFGKSSTGQSIINGETFRHYVISHIRLRARVPGVFRIRIDAIVFTKGNQATDYVCKDGYLNQIPVVLGGYRLPKF